MSIESEKLQILGKVTGYYGVKGWVKLHSYTDPRENIVRYATLRMKRSRAGRVKSGETWQSIRLDAGKAHGKGVVAHFAGYDSREMAAELIGAELAVYRADFKPAEKNEYYWLDLINLKVVNLEGVALGHVARLLETAANDVLVIRAAQKKGGIKKADEILIPYVPELYIKKIDLDAGVITVDWLAEWSESEHSAE